MTSLRALRTAFKALALSNPQLRMLMQAAAPMNVHDRAAFLNAVAVYFRGRQEVGDGELGRAIRQLQCEHYRPPEPPTGACAFDLAWHTAKSGRAR